MSFFVAKKTRDWASSQKISLHINSEVASTNTWAKEASSFKNPSSDLTLYLTENQTGGRGRNQNQWLAREPQGQLFSSWVYELEIAPQPILSPLVGLALFKSLSAAFGEHFALKAPNDIYLGNKKIAGILIENLQTSVPSSATKSTTTVFCLIIGIGLNVFSKPDLPSAGCLKDKLPEATIQANWEKFLAFLFKELSQLAHSEVKALNGDQRKELLQALNQFSLLPEKYLDVMADGSLQLPGKLIHWSDL